MAEGENSISDSKMKLLRQSFEVVTRDALPDIAVTIGDYSWRLDRDLIAHHSEFFKKATSGAFQEQATQEIQLYDDDPCAVARMIQFFYTGTYYGDLEKSKFGDIFNTSELLSCGVAANASGESVFEGVPMSAKTHAIMIVVADKYQIPALPDLAKDRMTSAVSSLAEVFVAYDVLEPLLANSKLLQKVLVDMAITVCVKSNDEPDLDDAASLTPEQKRLREWIRSDSDVAYLYVSSLERRHGSLRRCK